MNWLQNELTTDPKSQTQIAEAANRAGIAYHTLMNTKKQLGIRSRRIVKDGRAQWEWRMD